MWQLYLRAAVELITVVLAIGVGISWLVVLAA